MLTWRIYYSDGSSFSNEDGEPWEAPSVDVQIVAQGDDLLFYHDYYLYRSDLELWIPCNGRDGLLDQLMASARYIDAVINGRYMDNKAWQALLHKVRTKGAWSAYEARQLENRGVSIDG